MSINVPAKEYPCWFAKYVYNGFIGPWQFVDDMSEQQIEETFDYYKLKISPLIFLFLIVLVCLLLISNIILVIYSLINTFQNVSKFV